MERESAVKIAYLLILKGTKYGSVFDKVKSQVSSWTEMGADVRLFIVTDKTTKRFEHPNIEVIQQKGLFETMKVLKSSIAQFGPEIIYHRMWVLSPLLVPLLKGSGKLIAEVNTDTDAEITLEKTRSLKGALTYFYNLMTKSFYHNNLSGIVSVTNELANPFKSHPVEIVPNSIDVSQFPYRKSMSNNSKTSIFFIGSPGLDWHGIDILNQIALKSQEELHFHVVGLDSDVVKTPSENITFHGYLPAEKYEHIAKSCSVGLGTLALHRKGMKEACTLKVREYLAAGIPVILPYLETAFIDEKPSWVLEIDTSDDQVSDSLVAQVVKFAQEMRDVILAPSEVEKYIGNHEIERKRLRFMEALIDAK